MCTISLCMIARDEEDIPGRCPESVAGLVDEIIITDHARQSFPVGPSGSKTIPSSIAASTTRTRF